MNPSPVNRLFSLVLAFFSVSCTYQGHESSTGSITQALCSSCTSDSQCGVYASCIEGGSTACQGGRCYALSARRVDLECAGTVGRCDPGSMPPPVVTPPSPAGVCGTVAQPIEQQMRGSDLGLCRIRTPGIPERDNGAIGWVNAVTDTYGTHIRIVSFSVYCVQPGGGMVPVAGTAAGLPAITWHGYYQRSPWFPDDRHAELPVPADGNFQVPTNPYLLHMGTGGSVAGCREAFVLATIRTDGDAKVQIGFDYGVLDQSAIRDEGAFSHWVSCTTGTITITTPISTDLTCGARAIVPPSTTPPPPVDPDPTRANFVITLPPSGTGGCTGTISATAWDSNGRAISSSGGSLRLDLNPSGQVWWNFYCNGQPWDGRYGWNGSSPWRLTNAGFPAGTVRVDGVDRTAQTRICRNQNTHPQPVTAADPSLFDTCPPGGSF